MLVQNMAGLMVAMEKNKWLLWSKHVVEDEA